MRKIVLLEHVSLDGFLAGPNGEMDWIRVDDDMFEYVNRFTNTADGAIWGRVTYQMMESYWPTAGDSPGASKHDVDHSRWLAGAAKLVFSKTLTSAPWGKSGTARLVREDPPDAVKRLKCEPGGNLVLIGSASLARAFVHHGLIDEYYLNVNPVVLGSGMRLFPNAAAHQALQFVDSRTFESGVVGLHYTTTV